LKPLPCQTNVLAPRSLLKRRLVGALALTPAALSNRAFSESGHKLSDGTLALPYIDFSVTDRTTDRVIGVRARLPAETKLTGLILYSPGLGSGLSNGSTWCEAWQAAGYLVVNLSHPVTNESIWETGRESFQENLKKALASAQYVFRVKDCSSVLTYCMKDPILKKYIDPRRIGIAGHSYGALTVQAITGQTISGQDLRDDRIRAAIALSPGASSLERARLMSNVRIPFFSITGDHDQFVTFKDGASTMQLGISLDKRLMIFQQLPAGKKQLLILSDADHMSFAGEPVDPSRFSRDVNLTPEQQRIQWLRISAMSQEFWKYYLSESMPLDQQSQSDFQHKLRLHLAAGDQLKFD